MPQATPSAGTTAAGPTHATYQRLWNTTRVGTPVATVLGRWPKPPYQQYTDNNSNCPNGAVTQTAAGYFCTATGTPAFRVA